MHLAEANSEASEATSVLSDLAEGISELKNKLCNRNRVEPVMETNEDGSHEVDMDLILDERVIGVLQQIRYAAGMKVADAGMLRKAIIEKFAEKKEDGEPDNFGEDIANALVVWYFETVDPGAAPEPEEDTAVQDKLEELDAKVSSILELLEKKNGGA